MKDIGRIRTSDYLKLTRVKASGRHWILFASCALSISCGFGGGFLSGKNSHSMTLEAALEKLAQAPSEEWNQLAALGAAFRGVRSGVDGLTEWCSSRDDPGKDAALYLRHTARACILAIENHAQDLDNPHRAIHVESLERLRKELR